MAVLLQQESAPLSLEDESPEDEEFLQETKKYAQGFLAVFFQEEEEEEIQKDGGGGHTNTKSPYEARRQGQDHPVGGSSVDPNSIEVARRLRMLGDDIEQKMQEKLMEILKQTTILQFGQETFRSLCGRVLYSCQGAVHNGWQQVAGVFSAMSVSVRVLRMEQNVPEASRQQREALFQHYSGQVMQELGLDEWISEQGGMTNAGEKLLNPAHCRVEIAEKFNPANDDVD